MRIRSLCYVWASIHKPRPATSLLSHCQSSAKRAAWLGLVLSTRFCFSLSPLLLQQLPASDSHLLLTCPTFWFPTRKKKQNLRGSQLAQQPGKWSLSTGSKEFTRAEDRIEAYGSSVNTILVCIRKLHILELWKLDLMCIVLMDFKKHTPNTF